MSISNLILIPAQAAPKHSHIPLTHISPGGHLHSTYKTTHYLWKDKIRHTITWFTFSILTCFSRFTILICWTTYNLKNKIFKNFTIQQSLLFFMSISNPIMIPWQLLPTQTHFPINNNLIFDNLKWIYLFEMDLQTYGTNGLFLFFYEVVPALTCKVSISIIKTIFFLFPNYSIKESAPMELIFFRYIVYIIQGTYHFI